MAKTLLLSGQGSGITHAAALTRYYGISAGAPIHQNGTEANCQVKLFQAGTLSRLYLRLSANTVDGSSTVTSRVNSGAGAQSFSVGASTSGDFSDTTNSDSISSGDLIAMRIVSGGSTGSMTVVAVSAQWAASSNTVLRMGAVAYNGQTLNRNTTYYKGLGGEGIGQTTRAYAQHEFGTAGTLKNLRVNVGTYTISGTSTFSVEINSSDAGSPSAMGFSFSGTGWFEDTTNTAAVAVDDKVNYKATLAAGSGSQSAAINYCYIDFETTNAKYDLLLQKSAGFTNNVTVYYPLAGMISGTSTETGVRNEMGHAGKIARLWCYATAGTTGAALTLRKEGASTGLSLPVEASGYFEDTDTEVTFAATDELCYMRTGGSTTLRSVGVTVENTEGGGVTARVTAAQAEYTYTAAIARATAAQAELTYTAAQARVTAVQAEATYTAAQARVVAVQAELTYTAAQARVPAVQLEYTYSEAQARVVALQAGLEWQPLGARVVAVQAELTYTAAQARVVAAQAEYTYSAAQARVVAVQAAMDWAPSGARVVAVQATLTYSELAARVVALQASLDYTAAQARVVAAQATYTYDPVAARVVAAQVGIVWEPSGARVVALQVGLEYTAAAVRQPSNRQQFPDAGARVTPWQAIRPVLLWRKR